MSIVKVFWVFKFNFEWTLTNCATEFTANSNGESGSCNFIVGEGEDDEGWNDDNDDTGDPKDVDPTADIIQLLKNKN